MLHPRTVLGGSAVAAAVSATLGFFGCTKIETHESIDAGGTGTGGATVSAGTGGVIGRPGLDGGTTVPTYPPLTDFPATPVFTDPAIPHTAPDLFAAPNARTGANPCISSPEQGTLMPRNWLRPRFDFKPAGDENLFEVTLSIAGFAHQLHIYSRDRAVTLDRDLWNQLRTSINDQPVTVSVRALTLGGDGVSVQTPPSAAGTSNFTVAPVDAPGKIVYWSVNNTIGVLKGFGVGEEGVVDVLAPAQVKSPSNSTADCIGCHSATPDGESVGFTEGHTGYTNTMAYIKPDGSGMIPGTVPPYLTDSALTTIKSLVGVPAYSKGHWMDGDRIVILSDLGDLHWVQLDSTGSGTLARTGDSGKATEPSFSHDGNSIVYVSTKGDLQDGRAKAGPMDLYVVPYNNRMGGAAMPIPGAANPSVNEYYPALSPDDQFVAFTRLSGTSNDTYNNAQAEVYVVSAKSGDPAIRLKANDGPTCVGQTSPGLTNDWPKWAPSTSSASGARTFYWITFSSARSGNPQLYITPLVTMGSNPPQTYPALYLWNQPTDEGNHTPSWDEYKIASVCIDVGSCP